MKKLLIPVLVLVLCLSLVAGCAPQEEKADAPNISPLPTTIDVKNLTDCTVAVSLEKGDVFVDDTGKLQMKATVYTYDVYDMVDIANMKEGDVIARHEENTKINTLERNDAGLISINGGEENGGFDLFSADNTVYYEIGFNDVKSYYPLGEVTLPVVDTFVYVDESNLDAPPVEYFAGDFLSEDGIGDYHFVPHNAHIIIQGGEVVELHKHYIP